jgi:hypothetical protein
MTTEDKAEWLAKILAEGENPKRDLWLLAGIEPIAVYRQSTGKMSIKTGRCNMCGLCCQNADPFGDGPGPCRYLEQQSRDQWICRLGSQRPYSCCVADGHGQGIAECSVEYTEV